MLETYAQSYAKFFTELSPASLEQFEDYFAENVHFRDPFNDVYGIKATRKVFAHMYEQCPQARFTVHEIAVNATSAYLYWIFVCRDDLTLEGLSLVRFDAQGRVVEHLDYWDPAAQLYSKIPVLGGVLRWVRKRLTA